MKRKDFNATLKQLTDCLERMCSGSRFHSDGAATANDGALNFEAVLGITSIIISDDNLRMTSPSAVISQIGWSMPIEICGLELPT